MIIHVTNKVIINFNLLLIFNISFYFEELYFETA